MIALLRNVSRTIPVISERYSGKIEGKMDNSTRKDDGLNGRVVVIILLVLLLAALISLLSQSEPAAAQGFVTPTPLPAIQATLDAANAAQQSAQADLQQAAQMEAQAAELRRNGMVQQQQAAQAISDARAASIAQNAAAIGEAIGRAEANLAELSKTSADQADLISTLAVNQKIQAERYISDTTQLRNELQQERTAHQTIAANFTALQSRYDEQQSSLTISPVVVVIVGLTALFGVIGFVAWKWSRNGAHEPPAPPDPPIDGGWTVTDEDRKEDDSAENDRAGL